MILQGTNLKAVPIILADLKTRLPELSPLIKSAQFAVTVPERLQEVREILEPDYCRVMAIAFDLSQATIKQLSAITPDQKVGIVSTYPEYVNTMLNELAAYGPIAHTPIVALLSQEEQVRKMLPEINVLIYASGSEIVKQWAPKGLEMFEFLHTPKPDSVNRLRALL